MNKRVIAVLVGTFLALVAATVCVPFGQDSRSLLGPAEFEPYSWSEWSPEERAPTDYDWVWREREWEVSTGGLIAVPDDPAKAARWIPEGPNRRARVRWPLVFATHAFVLLFGGGLLIWVVRRGRRQDCHGVNKRVMAVLMCTFLALVAVTVVPPAVVFIDPQEWPPPKPRPPVEATAYSFFWPADLRFEAIWRLDAPPTAWTEDGEVWAVLEPHRIHWPLLITEQVLIILLGGGLLTLVVRRERRKRAAA